MWVKQVRDVAYNVEDTLQDFAVLLDRHRKSWWRIPRTLLDRRHVAKQMKELKDDVEDVRQRSMRYHLIKGSGSGSKPAATGGQSAVLGETMSGIEESRRQREKSKVNLVRLLNKRDNNNLKVIGVWGTSTVDFEIEGSTSIIKRAYDHLKRHDKFNCCAFIRLMSAFNPMGFIQNIIRQLYVSLLQESKQSEQASMEAQILRRMRVNKEEEDDLIDEFKGYLKEKSYLVVLTDVSSIKQWDQIKILFPHNKRGSRIMVFTPQVEVATLCVGHESLEPEHKQLSSDETLYAFYEKGYPEEEISPEPMPSPNATTSGTNNSMDRNSITRIDTMVFAALEESQLIGRVNERSEIIELVSNKHGQELQVMSLWGMGGLGKTTLFRDIYQSQEISQMFEARACATVMRPFNCEELLRSLAMQFGNVTDLRGYLDGKKYLIVLDDISSAAEFNAIIQHFPKTAGSCIIVTTREESIAKHCSNVEGNARKLSTLNYDDAHILLMRKVFKETVNLDDELVEQEELILKKCKGLPLAIVAIGGFLANQPKTALEWRKFNQHLSTELEMNPELETIRAVLLKSYDGLPYHLKSCFLYLDIFPEDHEVSKRRLVRRWIAEGYSREMRG
ncbi:hypothetical protein CFC21_106300 [Triticum aestivum]|uniref:NB-ARC domain-containing protein n=2 Tax=Triticum aestivum TaxID=4565 RepID=A0A9R1N9E1_WHEAT|nr:hypothetical protein CFC21_106300 [Triticum aestivum]